MTSKPSGTDSLQFMPGTAGVASCRPLVPAGARDVLALTAGDGGADDSEDEGDEDAE